MFAGEYSALVYPPTELMNVQSRLKEFRSLHKLGSIADVPSDYVASLLRRSGINELFFEKKRNKETLECVLMLRHQHRDASVLRDPGDTSKDPD